MKGEVLDNMLEDLSRDEITSGKIISLLSELEKNGSDDAVYQCCLELSEKYVCSDYRNLPSWRNIVREVIERPELSLRTKQYLASFD